MPRYQLELASFRLDADNNDTRTLAAALRDAIANSTDEQLGDLILETAPVDRWSTRAATGPDADDDYFVQLLDWGEVCAKFNSPMIAQLVARLLNANERCVVCELGTETEHTACNKALKDLRTYIKSQPWSPTQP